MARIPSLDGLDKIKDKFFPPRLQPGATVELDEGKVPEDNLPERLSMEGLSATYVRFVDQDGNPLPPGSVTTIHVNTTTGEIDDITFEEA